ncbi:DUF5658 family protein [Methanospirillum sp.]|uniref:DUF5658 family protein n=1 Tax=Methanospirillum sp. TaxID=45200 RepID=UPI002CB8CCF1|nr:DUF5658 family protein [Methanospirillum sp.]HPP78523.1 DUF5658 family protein [Methanospirillum sp.]
MGTCGIPLHRFLNLTYQTKESFRNSFSGWIFAVSSIGILQVLDLITTWGVFQMGGLELNPLFQLLTDTLWFWPAMICLKIALVIWIWLVLTISYVYYPRISRVACGIIIALYAAIIENNVLLMVYPDIVPNFC